MWLSRLRTWYLNYGFLLLGLLLLNVGVVNWYLWTKGQGEGEERETRVVEEEMVAECDEACVRRLVEEQLASQSAQEVVVEKGGVTAVGVKKTGEVKYVSLSPGTALSSADWTSVGGGQWLDTALYGSVQRALWEGWVEVPGGSGIVWVRLWDATNNRAVDGSEVSFKDTLKTSVYSGAISLWRGQNQYFVQVKSSGGGEVRVTSPRIKLEL